jgi:hypothetical protein
MKKKTILFEEKGYPVIQNIAYVNYKDAINCKKGDIKIVYDHSSGLVYNDLFDETSIEYTPEYNNEQGNSQFFKNHLNKVADLIEENIGKNSIVEVGCGKGLFLEMMLDRGIDIVGFDPTYVGNNPRVTKKFFEYGIIEKPSSGLVLRHVLEHIKNPYEFLKQLKEANGDQGLIYIEVPCFEWICSNRTWYDLFYEHVNYFRLDDFKRMFTKIISIGHIFGGQYLYVIADLSSLVKPIVTKPDSTFFPKDFMLRMEKALDDKLGRSICIWGAGSKGVIFAHLMQRLGKKIDFVIDVNPEKQGKYLPVTGLLVHSPDDCFDTISCNTEVYVMNSNYLEEIKEMSGNKFIYRLLEGV